ncbi:MAG: UvrABC system protein C [Candidatus Pelagibacterales bacterium]|jgi:excinuclease ABC subunit C|nr:MAG: UvrABC system protein C [Pelagibacterales bacterium]|tara:strand:+ start:603 stop:2435 length:1833 start_codon:yes stop_codon:yes gene_type:complete
MNNLENIKEIIDQSPSSSGIYKMLNEKEEIMYVGKAKNLQNRLKSYLNTNNLSNRIRRMVSRISNIEVIITETEKEALLLEANLIKKLKPPFNILLRDDKSFPYIFINHEQEFPQISKHRGKQKYKGKYFGPFATINSLNYTLKILQKVFLLRSCDDTIFQNRSKPCLLYQIERCSGPCVDYTLSKKEYLQSVKNAEHFLSGQHSNLQEELSSKMDEESKSLNYEKAASYRDKIVALTQIQSQQNINLYDVKNTDVISISRKGNKSCVQVFIYRSGQNWGNRSYFPKHSDEVETYEILERFIVDFYTRYSPPKNVLLNLPIKNSSLIETSLKSIYNYKTSFFVPKKGKKLDIVNYASRNSELALKNHIAQSHSDKENLSQLSKVLNITKKIKRVEAYDNSHLSGKNAVGAMIVYSEEGFEKKSYRKFNIDSSKVKLGDDYGMMRHVLERRFSKEAIKNSKKYEKLPDLLVIDGGKGHYDLAKEILETKGLNEMELISIFKGEGRKESLDQIIYKNKKNFIDKNTPSFFFIQRIRDESHRYAIGAHKAKRKREMHASELEPIEGLGRSRRKLLLNHFGSVKNIKNASAQDMMKVRGISKLLSEKIYAYFNG